MNTCFYMEPITNTMEHIARVDDILSKIRSAQKVVIWGTALAAELALYLCQKNGVQPNYIVDSFSHPSNALWNDIPLIGQDTLFSMPPNYFVIIACHEKYGIRKKLLDLHIPCVQFQSTPLFHANYPEDIRPLMDQKRPDIEYVFQQLSDDKSKEIYLHAVNYRRNFSSKHITALAGLRDKTPYWGNDIVPFIQGDTIIDCGAYIGDTLDAFFTTPECRCNSYFALEPTPKYFSMIGKYVQDHGLQNQVHAFPIAAWNRCDELSFLDSAHMGNMVTTKGSIMVHADTIDHILSDHCGKVDFIKMDIEGSEVPALCGAKEVICRDHPILAICIYHRITDLWEIPLLIRSMYEGYRFYVRHYSKDVEETVLYALP